MRGGRQPPGRRRRAPVLKAVGCLLVSPLHHVTHFVRALTQLFVHRLPQCRVGEEKSPFQSESRPLFGCDSSAECSHKNVLLQSAQSTHITTTGEHCYPLTYVRSGKNSCTSPGFGCGELATRHRLYVCLLPGSKGPVWSPVFCGTWR